MATYVASVTVVESVFHLPPVNIRGSDHLTVEHTVEVALGHSLASWARCGALTSRGNRLSLVLAGTSVVHGVSRHRRVGLRFDACRSVRICLTTSEPCRAGYLRRAQLASDGLGRIGRIFLVDKGLLARRNSLLIL